MMVAYVSGFNSFGQLGNLIGDFSKINSVLSFQPFKRIRHISFTRNCVAIVDDEGAIMLSGFIDNKSDLIKLEQAPFSHADITQIGTTKKDLLVITSDGQLWEYKIGERKWRSLKSLLPLSSVDELENKVVNICAGAASVCIILQNGRAFQLPQHELETPNPVVDVCYGYEHGMLLTSKGEVMTWGTALRGALGNDSTDACTNPTEVRGLAGIRCTSIAAGGFHCCAVSSDGDLYTWGWNRFGQLGFPTHDDDSESSVSTSYIPLPVDWRIMDPSPVISVHCGSGHTIVLLENGELWGCGWNKYGQLALPNSEYVSSMTKLPVPCDKKIVGVVCGYWNSAIFVEGKTVES